MRSPMIRVLCTAMALAGLAGCTPSVTPTPAPAPLTAVPVALTLTGAAAKQRITVGLLVGPVAGEGSEYRDASEGTRVAAYRFDMTGADVEIAVALDDGTADGAADALNQLASQNVAGIVVASSGPHIQQALALTHIAQPILLPYETPGSADAGAWATGPIQAAVSHAVTQALTDLGVTHPYLIADPAQPALDVSAAATQPVASATGEQVVDAIAAGTADSVIIDAPAADQARLVTDIQQHLAGRQTPILLTPQALTPAFAQAVLASGPPSTTLVAVGANTSDVAALTTDAAGAHISAFLTGVRLAASDANCLNVFKDAPFSQAAGQADIASHDAVVALVRAVEKAGSTDPASVRQALAGMTISPDDGLAGPALGFTTPDALSSNDVQPLYASTEDPGLRPSDVSSTMLYWFPLA